MGKTKDLAEAWFLVLFLFWLPDKFCAQNKERGKAVGIFQIISFFCLSVSLHIFYLNNYTLYEKYEGCGLVPSGTIHTYHSLFFIFWISLWNPSSRRRNVHSLLDIKDNIFKSRIFSVGKYCWCLQDLTELRNMEKSVTIVLRCWWNFERTSELE